MNCSKTQTCFMLTALMLSLTACNSKENFKEKVGRVIAEDPSIFTNAIEQNPDEFTQTLRVLLERAKVLAKEKERENRRLETMKYIRHPLVPRTLEDDVYFGQKNAPITIVQYIDFECPYCNKGMRVMDRLRTMYPNKVRFLVRHMPLSIHPNAATGAIYFEALKRQGREIAFAWHDNVFYNQAQINEGEDFYRQMARNVGANMAKLRRDLNDKSIMLKIQNDVREAKKFGFKGTPGYVVGGVPVAGAYPEDEFIRIIEQLSYKEKLSSR